jgi:hypothetical protein
MSLNGQRTTDNPLSHSVTATFSFANLFPVSPAYLERRKISKGEVPMKKIVILMVFLLSVGSLFAGEGKSCDKSKHSAKNVTLTGKIVSVDGKQIFRVSDSDTQYSVCDKSKAKLSKLSGDTVKIKGQLVSCDDGEELMINEAAKI